MRAAGRGGTVASLLSFALLTSITDTACTRSAHARAARATTTLVPCTNQPDQVGPPPEFVITAINTTYDRHCIDAAAGRLVLVFNNRDSGVGHSLTVADPTGQQVITSGVLMGPRDFSLNFVVSPGTYHYHCDVHPRQMNGTLVVR